MKLRAPSIVDPREQKITLYCEYNLGNFELYSVNWYRSENVIFRYMPTSNPRALIFKNDPKVNVSFENSDSRQLVLIGNSDFRKSNSFT